MLGDGADRAEFERQAAAAGVARSFSFEQNHDNADLPQFWAAADVFVFALPLRRLGCRGRRGPRRWTACLGRRCQARYWIASFPADRLDLLGGDVAALAAELQKVAATRASNADRGTCRMGAAGRKLMERFSPGAMAHEFTAVEKTLALGPQRRLNQAALRWLSRGPARSCAEWKNDPSVISGEAKDAVASFWERASCGEIYAAGASAADGLDEQARRRYLLEPYIRDFARFDGGTAKDVLEIGVGMGADHLQWAKARPRSLTGVDLTSRAVQFTRDRLSGGCGLDLRISASRTRETPFSDNSFDLVWSWGVLHHTPDTPRAVQEAARRVLRPGQRGRRRSHHDVYHRRSLVGAMLWARYGLLAGKPLVWSLNGHLCQSPRESGDEGLFRRRSDVPLRWLRAGNAVRPAELCGSPRGRGGATPPGDPAPFREGAVSTRRCEEGAWGLRALLAGRGDEAGSRPSVAPPLTLTLL